MTRRITSIEVKNNSVYVNGRKARDTEGLIENIKPTQLIIPEGLHAGKPYRGDAYEGTSGGYKFVLLIQKDRIFFQWDHVGKDRFIGAPENYDYNTGKREFKNFNSLSDVFTEMGAKRSLCQKDPFAPEWASSFEKLIKRFEKTYNTITNCQARYGYGWGKKRVCSKREALWDRMEVILYLLEKNYFVEMVKYSRETNHDLHWDVHDYFYW